MASQEAFHVSPIRIKYLDSCEFTVQESDVDGYKVLVLPEVIQRYFDEGYDAVRIYSTDIAATLPEHGGRTAASHSLTPHQDHLPADPKRFLALSRPEDAPRGSATYFSHPETAAQALPEIRAFFEQHRAELKEIFTYDPASQVSEAELRACFEDPSNIDRLVGSSVGPDAQDSDLLFAYCGIFTYLIQGTYADDIVAKFLEQYENDVAVETWERGGVLILDNPNVFHGRFGANEDPIQRNWFISGI